MDLENYPRDIWKEVNEIPRALEELYISIKGNEFELYDLIAKKFNKYNSRTLFGMASSHWAGWPFIVGNEMSGRRIQYMTAYDGAVHKNSYRHSFCILVSQSGETIEIVNLVNQLKEMKTTIIGVTNSLNSYLAVNSDYVIYIHAGLELFAPSKSYINTISALLILLYYIMDDNSENRKLVVDDVYFLSLNIYESLKLWEIWAKELAITWLERPSPIQLLSDRIHYNSALQSSMLLSEVARVFSAVNDWATFRHGFEPQVKEDFFAVGFKPCSREDFVWNTSTSSIKNRRGRISMVPDLCHAAHTISFPGRSILGQEFMQNVWETIPMYYLSSLLAVSQGIDPRNIERKVTTELK